MQFVIIAGGLGTRLRPLTDSRPKALIPLANRPQILYAMDRRPSECDEIIVAVNYRYEDVRDYFARQDVGVKVTVVEEREPLGTAGAIKNVEDHLDGTFALANGDVIDSLDFDSFLAFHRKMHGVASLVVVAVDDPTAYGVVALDGDRITRFVEKPQEGEAPSHLANAGRYVFEPAVLSAIDAGRAVSLEREVFPRLIPKGLNAFCYSGPWSDAGTLPNYLRAQRLLLESATGIASDADVSRGRIQSPVLIGPGCFVEGAIGPSVALGSGCQVGRAIIRNASLFDRAVVDDKAEVDGSIVGAGATIGERAVVRSSIVGDGVHVPAHARVFDARVSA